MKKAGVTDYTEFVKNVLKQIPNMPIYFEVNLCNHHCAYCTYGAGNAENVIRTLSYANEIGTETIAFNGYDGGKLRKLAKYNIHVAVDNMQITEDVHLVLNHLMMYILSGMRGC